jgi:hypothetical protein
MRDYSILKGGGVLTVVVVSVLAMLCVSHSAMAQVQLTDQNAVLNIVTNSSAGMNSWTIDGQNVLDQQWFWYRVGNTGGQSSLDTLPSTITVNPSQFVASYTGSTFVVTLTLNLGGSTPGSGSSDLGILINIQNTSPTSALPFHLFEYSNFTLGGVPGDNVTFTNANAVVQTGALGSLSETVVTGTSGSLSPNHHEADVSPVTLNELTGGTPVTLDDTNSAGPGDVTWAFEWDPTVNPNRSTSISKDINVLIPEPSSLLLVGMAVTLIGLFARRKLSV